MVNSTVSGNSVDGVAGGIYTFGPATITSSTIAFNSARILSGGIMNQSGQLGTQRVTLGSTIIANNTYSGGNDGDIYSDFNVISLGNNLVQNPAGFRTGGWVATDLLHVNPQLRPLGDYGGATPTHAIPNQVPPSIKARALGEPPISVAPRARWISRQSQRRRGRCLRYRRL